MKVDVLVFMYQGVIDDIKVLEKARAEQVAQRWLQGQGYKSYEDLKKARDRGQPDYDMYWHTDVEVELWEGNKSYTIVWHGVEPKAWFAGYSLLGAKQLIEKKRKHYPHMAMTIQREIEE